MYTCMSLHHLAIMTKPSLSCLLCFLCMLAIPIFPFLKFKEFLNELYAYMYMYMSIHVGVITVQCTKRKCSRHTYCGHDEDKFLSAHAGVWMSWQS